VINSAAGASVMHVNLVKFSNFKTGFQKLISPGF